ncbi:MAG TPA: hypothetical protein VIY99_04835, partial [Terracidiphilus sp.]
MSSKEHGTCPVHANFDPLAEAFLGDPFGVLASLPRETLCCLHGDMSKQELTLLQFTASLMAKASASPAHMPHAASAQLCRMPDYAESLAKPLFSEVMARPQLAAVRHNNLDYSFFKKANRLS